MALRGLFEGFCRRNRSRKLDIWRKCEKKWRGFDVTYLRLKRYFQSLYSTSLDFYSSRYSSYYYLFNRRLIRWVRYRECNHSRITMKDVYDRCAYLDNQGDYVLNRTTRSRCFDNVREIVADIHEWVRFHVFLKTRIWCSKSKVRMKKRIICWSLWKYFV